MASVKFKAGTGIDSSELIEVQIDNGGDTIEKGWNTSINFNSKLYVSFTFLSGYGPSFKLSGFSQSFSGSATILANDIVSGSTITVTALETPPDSTDRTYYFTNASVQPLTIVLTYTSYDKTTADYTLEFDSLEADKSIKLNDAGSIVVKSAKIGTTDVKSYVTWKRKSGSNYSEEQAASSSFSLYNANNVRYIFYKPASTHTETASASNGVSYTVYYYDADGAETADISAGSSKSLTVANLTTLSIDDIVVEDGYKENYSIYRNNSKTSKTTFATTSTNGTIRVETEIDAQYYMLYVYHYDKTNKKLLQSNADTDEFLENTSIDWSEFTNDYDGYNAIGYGSSTSDNAQTSEFGLEGTTTIYIFYENPKLNFEYCTQHDTNNAINVSVINGVSTYDYLIRPYTSNKTTSTAVGYWKTFKSNYVLSTYTFSGLPYGFYYNIKVIDGQNESVSLNTSNYVLVNNNEPGFTWEQNENDYQIKVTAAYNNSGYSSFQINDQVDSNGNAIWYTSSGTYTYTSAGQKTLKIRFRHFWQGDENNNADITYTSTKTINLISRYEYSLTTKYYYCSDESTDAAISFGTTASYITSTNEISPPNISGYTYKSYSVSASGETTRTGTSHTIPLFDEKKNNVILYYWKDSYPCVLEQWYYNSEGTLVQYVGPNGKNPPYTYFYNENNFLDISGTLTGKGVLEQYRINNDSPVLGNNSSVQRVDLSNYKNIKAIIKAYYYLNLEWINSPYFVTGTNKLRASWTGGRAGYRFEYFTDYTHHYYPGQGGLANITSYPPDTSNSYNLPGGYWWDILLTDRANKTLTETVYSSIVPSETNDDIQLEFTDAAINLKATVSAFYNTGYNAVRLEYKRATDTDWTIAIKSSTPAATTLSFNLESDIRLNKNANVIYHTRLVWYDSECDTTSYSYEYKTSTKIFYLGYKTTLVVQDRIKSLNISYTTITNDYHENWELAGGDEYEIWLQYQSSLRVESYAANLGYYGPEFDIDVGDAVEIISSETYEFNLANKTELYHVTLECGKNISRYTIKYYDYAKSNALGTYAQEELTIEAGTSQTIETPITHSNIVLISWANDEYNGNMLNEATLLPVPRLVAGEKTYDASQFHLRTLSLSIDFYKTKFTKSAYVDYCEFQLVDENGENGSTIIKVTSEADEIYFYEFSPTMPYHTHIKIIDYKLIAGRKNFYMNISGDSERYYLKDYSNNLIPIERGESYIFNGDNYINPAVTIEPDKYSVTCSYSYIDEEVFLGSPHKVTFTQQKSGTKITEFIDFKTAKSITFTNTIVNNKYSIFADTEFTILTELWDAQSNRWIEITSEGNKTLPRDIPDFTIQPNISNRAYGDISNYQDYDKVVSYHWNTTASLADATSITVIDNKTENVNTQKIPSGDQPFELDSTYYVRIVLGATDGSDATWTSAWVKIDTPDAYTITFVLNNINSITAKSDLTNNANQIFENNGVLTVSPNGAYEISGINSYSSLTTPYNRKMSYKSPVYYTIIEDGDEIQNGVFVSRDNHVSKITGNMDTPALTITLTATPADWVWPNGYTKETTSTGTPILTKGGEVSLFEYEAWNELMFYLNKWGQYLNKLYTNYENTLMTSENTTLTAAIYNHAYAQLNTLFTNLSDAIITNAVSNETQVTAKGLEDFGNTINYNNIKE